MRPKEGTIKDYPSVEVWVEGFLNYIMILIVMCKNLSKIFSNFLDIYCNPSTYKSASISKRARVSTDILRTCYSFNRGKCDLGKDCKFPHTCSKCGGPYTARNCK